MGVRSAVNGGDHRSILEALRVVLAESLDDEGTPVYAKAQLARELRNVLADLRALPAPPVDQPAGVVTIADAKAKRAARQSAAAAEPAAKTGGRKRG